MSTIQFSKKPFKKRKRFTVDRDAPSKVLGVQDPGASKRGNSYYKEARLCPREHGLSKVAKLRREGDYEALTQGFTFHHALEVYYRTIQAHQQKNWDRLKSGARYWGNQEDAEKAAWASIEPMRTAEGYQDTYAEIERMLVAYFDNYRMKDRWRIVAVEETFEYDDEEIAYSARLDLIVEIFDDRGTSLGMWIVEHKTARAITDDLIAGYDLDQQILGQVWLLNVCVDLEAYPPLQGILINLTSKHTTPQLYRHECLPSRAHLDEFEDSIAAWNQVLETFRELDYPKALGNCAGPARYWSRCQFYSLCHGQPRMRVKDFAEAEPPFGFVRKDDNDE